MWDKPNTLPVKAQQEGDAACGEHYLGDMCKRTLSRHTCESQPALLVQHRGKMTSLIEERTGKLAAEAASLLLWLQDWVTELGLPRLTAQHHVRLPLGRSLLPVSAPVDTLSL